jgi:hypothetical protein
MTTHTPILNTTSPLSRFWERVRVRAKAVEMMRLTKRQIEVTMFAAGIEHFEDLAGKLVQA